MIAAQRILCPIDFSDGSRRALLVATTLARYTGAQIIVLHVGEAVSLYPAVVAQVDPVQVANPTRAERAAQAASFIAPFNDAHRPMTLVLAEGEAAAVIAATIAEHHVDLVVMGTRGHRGFRRLVTGSTARRVAHTVACPVLVVPPDPAPVPKLPAFERIVCRGTAPDLSYARAFAADAASHVEAGPPGERGRELLTRAATARPDLIVWDRSSGGLDEILDNARTPVLVVAGQIPASWQRRHDRRRTPQPETNP